MAIGVAVVLVFVGAGGAANDTAGKFSGLSLKGAAEGAGKVVDGEPSLVSCLAAGSVAPAAVEASVGRPASGGEPK